jgi:hypothetical protein
MGDGVIKSFLIDPRRFLISADLAYKLQRGILEFVIGWNPPPGWRSLLMLRHMGNASCVISDL